MSHLDVPYSAQETDDTCAPACLRMALAFRFPKKPFSEATLARECKCLPGLGSRIGDVFRAALRFRLKARWLDGSRIAEEVEKAINEGCPVVANVQLRALPYAKLFPQQAWHSALIVGIDAEYVYLHDPDPIIGGSKVSVRRSAFFAEWAIHPYIAYRL
ncbi:MAG: C39 family peptidase [Acidobacteriota bacterium]